MLTVVVYHYVRDTSRTRFQRLKALSLSTFDAQLDYLARHYAIVGGRDVVRAVRGEAALPSNACWLTFDDGLMDHVAEAVPRLKDHRMTASFFATVEAADRERVLDVHKAQFIRAAVDDPRVLIDTIFAALRPFRQALSLPDDDALFREYSQQWDRWDGPDQVFIKAFLQRGPEPVRTALVNELFARFVTVDERAFAAELYADRTALQHLIDAGMDIGAHGATHRWLGKLSTEEQADEVVRSREFLISVDPSCASGWVMCYPHGSHNADTLPLLRDAGCVVGLSLEPGIVSGLDAPLTMPRLDTNDLPRA